MHSLLARQLKRHLGDLDAQPENVRAFVAAVDAAYQQEDSDRQMLERSMEIMSQELGDRNRALRLMAEASSVFSSSLDYETTLTNVARLAVPVLADFCSVDLIDENGAVQRLAMEHVNPEKIALARKQQEYPHTRNTYGVRNVLESGTTFLDADITLDKWADIAQDAGHLELFRELGYCSILRVPLATRGRVIGAMSFFYADSGRHHTPADVELAEDMARRASFAIDNARLYREATNAERQLRELNVGLEQRVAERTAELETANRELEEASRQKSEFLANMSHELRTPLNAIIGFSEVLIDPELSEMPREQHDEFLGNIHNSGKHLLNIINDILDLSKVEAGRMEIHCEPVSVRSILTTCATTIAPLAERKDITLAVECTPERGQVWADPSRLKQVLLNLLSNAIKFTPAGGRVYVNGEVGADRARIVVRDTGIGIKPEDQAMVFEEFRQVDQAKSREQEGTGLGLALVKRFVELHGGSIALDSTPGEGSTFTVTLPLPEHLRNQVAPAEAPQEAAADDRLTILMVEDDDTAAELLRFHLEHAGYRVAHAHGGNEALTLARQLHPFAITLDVLMPDRDGWQVLSSLKSDPQTAEVPVILVSSVDSTEKGFAMGAADYLVKPVERDRLLATISRATNRLHRDAKLLALVVDDDPIAAHLFETVVENTGNQAVIATTGVEALRLAEEQPVDVVILDLLMPGMSGFEVLDKLRQSPRTSGLPIIVCTAKDLTPDDVENLRGRVLSVVPKGMGIKHSLLDEILRLERAHPDRSRLAGSDGTLENFLSHLDREASRSQRYARSFSVMAARLQLAEGQEADSAQAELKLLAGSVCPVLAKQLRRHDILIQHAGAEILVLLPEVGPEASESVMDKLRSAARQQTNRQGQPLDLAIGYASYPEDGESGLDLLQRARHRAMGLGS